MWWNLFSNAQIETAVTNALNGALIHQASVTLGNAEILTLPSLAQTIIGVPAADWIVLPITPGLGVLDTTAAPIASDADASLVLFTEIDYLSAPVKNIHGLLQTQAISPVIFAVPYLLGAGNFADTVMGDFTTPIARWMGRAIQVKDDYMGVPDYTGGALGNTLTIALPFVVYDVTNKRFLTTVESAWDEDTRTFS